MVAVAACGVVFVAVDAFVAVDVVCVIVDASFVSSAVGCKENENRRYSCIRFLKSQN